MDKSTLKLYVSSVRKEAQADYSGCPEEYEIEKIARPLIREDDISPEAAVKGESKRSAVSYMITSLFHTLLHAPETLRVKESDRSITKVPTAHQIVRTVEIADLGPLEISHFITLRDLTGRSTRIDMYRLRIGGLPDIEPEKTWINDPVIEKFVLPAGRMASIESLGATLETLKSLSEIAGI